MSGEDVSGQSWAWTDLDARDRLGLEIARRAAERALRRQLVESGALVYEGEDNTGPLRGHTEYERSEDAAIHFDCPRCRLLGLDQALVHGRRHRE